MVCECCLEARSADLGWVNISQLTVIVGGPKFTNFLFNVEEIVVINAIYRLLISSVVLEIFALKVHARTDKQMDARTLRKHNASGGTTLGEA